jgi:CheY-like chemotaxis protein
VLVVAEGQEALELAAREPAPIGLLIGDIVLPGIQGAEIDERLRRARPDIKVLFSSGYPGDEVTRRGLPPDAAFMARPFAPDDLIRAVAELLDGTDPRG